MSQGALCWECREIYKRIFKKDSIKERGWNHCHHKQREKPKEKVICWCKSGGNPSIFKSGGVLKVIFCPECGRKLV